MMTDELLRDAAARSWERYAADRMAEYDPAYSYAFSPGFERGIRKLRRKADHPVLYRTAQRAAVILLAFLLFGMVWIAFDAKARAAFFGWFGEFDGDYFVLRHEGAARPAADDSGGAADYRPVWLPEGYSGFSSDAFADKTTVLYRNEEGKILRFSYLTGPEEASWFFDDTGGTVSVCRVNDQEGTLFLSETEGVSSSLTWSISGETAACITGFLSADELLKIAESVTGIQYRPSWIPEGYFEKSVSVFNDKTTLRYVNDKGEILRFSYVMTSRNRYWGFDISQGETRDCRVDGHEAKLFISHEDTVASAVVWIEETQDAALYVTGFLSADELLRIAESVSGRKG